MEIPNLTTIIENNKVIFRRFFDSPKELVFEAWTSHEHLSQWWGPDGFSITTQSLNFSNGGEWRFIMHGPDGRDYGNRIIFVDIKKPDFIIYDQSGVGGETADVRFRTVLSFRDAEGGTDFEIEMTFPTKEELDFVSKNYGAIEGGQQHLTRLGLYLESKKRSSKS